MSILRKRVSDFELEINDQLPEVARDHILDVDPIQATYRGGRLEPLHSWYPFLEGFSPAFVEAVVHQFCPSAETILDPFSGTGTTPLTVAKLGKRALYCEVNPVLQFVVSVKTTIMQLAETERNSTANRVIELSTIFRDKIHRVSPDDSLRQAYCSTFGKSIYFDEATFDTVLKCRTLIDEIATQNSLIARLLTVAVLRSLLPVSKLIRRGDVRFMTKSELDRFGNVELTNEIIESLIVLASDVRSLESNVDYAPKFLLENAKNLDDLPHLELDAVITSPPYLNGTNYVRNTKIELWFLRCVKCRADLTRLRFMSMTAGINDVTIAKSPDTLPGAALEVIRRLEVSAYDVRIPRMVSSFASEMHHVLQALAKRMHKNSTIAIDIGDSAYAGVRVPTDRFIVESLQIAGFTLMDRRILRTRRSRSQIQLTQQLLVFGTQRVSKQQRSVVATEICRWKSSWESFKRHLPHQSGEFAKRNWGHSRHSLCSYQGKMKPALAAHLVQTFTTPGDTTLDPFSGVGTIAFEAALQGVETWAFDISPPAVHITAGKIGKTNFEQCIELTNQLKEYIDQSEPTTTELVSAESIRFNGSLPSYFHRRTLKEILLARRFFLKLAPTNHTASFVLACLLHILHGNRPYALSRRSHPITPFAPSGPTEYRALIPRLRNKIERSLEEPLTKHFTMGHSLLQDVTDQWPMEIQNLDAIVTSPPFFASTRFHAGNWMRLWFTGWELKDFRVKPASFIDEKQKRGFDVYESFFRQSRERMKRDAVLVLHLGGSSKCDMARELGRVSRPWFRVVDTYVEDVTHCERHGIRDKGHTTSHQYLVMR